MASVSEWERDRARFRRVQMALGERELLNISMPESRGRQEDGDGGADGRAHQELGGGLPNMEDALRSRVGLLSKAKQLRPR